MNNVYFNPFKVLISISPKIPNDFKNFLNEKIVKNRKNNFKLCKILRNFSYQLFLSIKIIHSYSIVHLDVRSQNILFSDDFEKIFLFDFDMAQVIDEKSNIFQKKN